MRSGHKVISFGNKVTDAPQLLIELQISAIIHQR
jgi:hypothetical protein